MHTYYIFVLDECLTLCLYVDDVKVRLSGLQPLSEHCLSLCSDERTREFACALIDFARWDVRRTGTVLEGSDKYQWPAYIYNMVSKPRDWAAWRSIAERRALREKTSKRSAYFLTMQQEYIVTSEAEDNDEVESENTEDDDLNAVKEDAEVTGSSAVAVSQGARANGFMRELRGSPLKGRSVLEAHP